MRSANSLMRKARSSVPWAGFGITTMLTVRWRRSWISALGCAPAL